jgi:hypothetical protein
MLIGLRILRMVNRSRLKLPRNDLARRAFWNGVLNDFDRSHGYRRSTDGLSDDHRDELKRMSERVKARLAAIENESES